MYCRECGARPPIWDKKLCARCRATKRARQEPGLEHNVDFLAYMFAACYDPASCCSATGRSLLALRKVGELLSVDRINPMRGYLPGNVQLLALSLNEAKREHRRVPQADLNALLRRLERVTDDALTPESAAAQTL